MFKKFLLKTFCVLLLGSSYLQSYGLEILFSRYSISDGLSSNFVNCIWQDPRGFMWVGTENGLQRYDGSKFTSFYRNSNQQKLPALAVHQILRDAKSTMWIRMGNRIGTFNTFNYTFKEVKVVSKQAIPGRSDYYLRRDYKGNLLLTILKFGIFVYNEKKEVFEENRNVLYVPSHLGINHSFEDKKTGDYWLSTDKGLALFNVKNKKVYTAQQTGWNKFFINQPGLDKNVTHLHIDQKRRYWIVAGDNKKSKSYCYDEATGKFVTDTIGLNSDKGYSEIRDFKESRGILWAYGLHFLKIHQDPAKGFYTFYNNDSNYGIKFNSVNHIFEDREKNVWIATDNGLYAANVIFNEARHGLIKKTHTEDAITSILKTSHSNILLSTSGSDIEALKTKNQSVDTDSKFRDLIYRNQPAGQPQFQTVWDMEEHLATKSIWLACRDGGLISYSLITRESKFLNPQIFEGKTIRQITSDKAGSLWFGTQSGKLVKLENKGDKTTDFKLIENLQAPIVKFYIDNSGILWVCTEGKGIFSIDATSGKIVQSFSNKGKAGSILSDNAVRDIIQFNDTLFYAATGNLDI
ncbi:MAG: hypothetical protein H7Y07_05225, partial [Pyrinomonadaceae bacterium]|nr:hypothetical protein [Sphingobacteriaceae bacterium]